MPGWTSQDIAAITGRNPYGTLGPSPARTMVVNRQGPPPEKYYTYKSAAPGRDPKDVIKLLAGQKLGFLSTKGYYARPGGKKGKVTVGGGGAGGAGAKQLTDEQLIQKYTDMLTNQQKGVLDALLADRRREGQGAMAALGGFGAALQGYSHDLWGQTDQAYRDAANQQQSMAAGLAQQSAGGLANIWARAGELASGLGYTGQLDLPSVEAAKAQVESEGGARTGDMMSQVGHAWGGYGATRPEYIGFMTGQNQMQLAREQMEGDRDLQSEFLKLGMDNPATAFDMFTKMQENKRQNVSTSLAQQTLRTNIAMQKAKLKADWQEARLRAKTAADKLAVDRKFKGMEAQIDQQNADASTTRANASVVSANASATRAQTAAEKAKWERNHPSARGTPAKYSQGTFQEKVASAMYNAHNLFDDSGAKKATGRTEYAFRVLWPQMEAYIPKAQQARAKNMLRQRLRSAANMYKPKPTSGGGGGDDW